MKVKLLGIVLVLLNLQAFGVAEAQYDRASVSIKNKSGQDVRIRVLMAKEGGKDEDSRTLKDMINQHEQFDTEQKKIARGWMLVGKGSARFTQPGQTISLPTILVVTSNFEAKNVLPRQYFYLNRWPHKAIKLDIEKGKDRNGITIKPASGIKDLHIEELNFGTPLKTEIIKKHMQAIKDLGFDSAEYLTVQQIFDLADDATVEDIKSEIRKKYDHYKNNKVPQFRDRVERIIALLKDINDSYNYSAGISDRDIEKKIRALDL